MYVARWKLCLSASASLRKRQHFNRASAAILNRERAVSFGHILR